MDLKNNFIKATAAVALTAAGITAVNAVKPSATAHVQAATTQVKIHYVSGYGINIWNNYEHGHFTGTRAMDGTTWNVMSTVKDSKGTTWYQIGTHQWIMAQYTVAADQPVKKAKTTAIATTKPAVKKAVTTTAVKPKTTTKKSAQASSDASGVLALAKAQVGKPYVWGGTGTNGFDCSGLVQYIYKNAAGVDLGRTTYDQINQGKSVSLSSLQPGDLLFWGNYHVGIYLGNNQYVHAPAPGQNVKVQTISSYFYPTSAKRVLG